MELRESGRGREREGGREGEGEGFHVVETWYTY
jgi:hypothetical protein